MSSLRRLGHLRGLWLRIAVILLLAGLFIDLLLAILLVSPSQRVSTSTKYLTNSSRPAHDRIFIASIHWNTEITLRAQWNAAVLDLVEHFGAENVYISIIESGSWDNTTGALQELDQKLEILGAQRSIQLLNVTHKDEIERKPAPDEPGWVWTSREQKELRRIPYLAGIRNQVMEKLNQLANSPDEQERQTFGKVLWLNDVIFKTEDVTTLIGTRDGDYAAACALDFSNPPLYYDTFAMRDISGAKSVSLRWPYFLARASRNALISNSPTPLKSCWNGMIVFQAQSFYANSPLRFRGISDDLAANHLEGSECCLIHIDNQMDTDQKVWLNPNVRVAYNIEAYRTVNPVMGIWPNGRDRIQGIWYNRFWRWSGLPRRYLERRTIERRIQSWRAESQSKGRCDLRPDELFCLVNEMQVLAENGWAHV